MTHDDKGSQQSQHRSRRQTHQTPQAAMPSSRRAPVRASAQQQRPRRQEGMSASAASLSRGSSGYEATPRYTQQAAQRSAAAPAQPSSNPYMHAPSRMQDNPYAQRSPRRGARAERAARSRTVSPYQQEPKRSPLGPLLFFAALVLLLFAGGWFVISELTKNFDVTINGQELTVTRGDTVASLIEEGTISVKPGDLFAIDGTLIEKGAGQLCRVSLNGEPADEHTKITRGAILEVYDGADETEEYSSREESVPHGSTDTEATFESYYLGAIHLLEDGRDGKETLKTGNISGKSVRELVEAPVDKGYYVYSVETDDKVIALTFDDGPWPTTTDAILDVLEANNAKATFFTLGEQIASYSEQVRRAHEMGCDVLTHSWDHAAGSGQGVNMTYMSAAEQVEEIKKGYAAIAEITGQEPPHILRAPGGNFYGDCVNNVWSLVDVEIGWDIDTEDWRLPGAEAIAFAIESAQPGSVVLLHDGGGDRSQTVAALKIALPKLAAQGYRFVTITELLEYGMPEQSQAQEQTSEQSQAQDSEQS